MSQPWTPERRKEAQAKAKLTWEKKKAEAKGVTPPSEVPAYDPANQQSAAVRARWAAEKGTEEDVRQMFVQINVEEGLQILAKMRANCETAASVLNQRITADETKERCKTCGGEKKQNKDWILRRPHRDPVTQQIVTDVFCQMACVAMENQKQQGTYGISDRGMLATDNPRTKAEAV